MVRIGLDEKKEEVEIGDPIDFGPWEITIPDEGNYVECLGIPLSNVPFEQSGVYEFQLWADGVDEKLLSERIEVRN
jgi:hypothetical protein